MTKLGTDLIQKNSKSHNLINGLKIYSKTRYENTMT
jgi:hypothetical protein